MFDFFQIIKYIKNKRTFSIVLLVHPYKFTRKKIF